MNHKETFNQEEVIVLVSAQAEPVEVKKPKKPANWFNHPWRNHNFFKNSKNLNYKKLFR